MRRIAGWRTESCAAVAATWLLASPAGAAIMVREPEIAVPQQTSCASGERLQLTIGLPPDYSGFEAAEGLPATPGFEQVCASTTTGSPYQLLSWLENDYLQVAVLPAFAVTVLQRENPARFASHYLVLDRSPFRLLSLKQRPLAMSVSPGSSGSSQRFMNLFAPLEKGEEGVTIVLPHHLSGAIDVLMTRAGLWADERALSARERERFFATLIDSIRFREPLGPTPPAAGEYEIAHIGEPVTDEGTLLGTDRDVLVVHCHIVNSYRELQHLIEAQSCARSAPDWLAAPVGWLDEALRDRRGAVGRFLSANYDLQEQGSMARRYFRFTVLELWGVLGKYEDSDADASAQPRGLALVLTGGGVKAAYQTRLVEQLYQSGKLQNGGAAAARNGAQQVDYVIGTSGGALLGIFVSALDPPALQNLAGNPETGLTSVLWGAAGERIHSRHIFPLQDMLRYGSIAACFLVLWLVGRVALRFRAASYPQVKMIAADSDANASRRRAPESPPWILLMLAAPLIIASVARGKDLEHMPAITGIFYILMALIVLDADQRYRPIARFEWRSVQASGLALVLALSGLAAILVSLFLPWQRIVATGVCENWAPALLICCAGFVLLAAALHAFFGRQTKFLRREDGRPLLKGLLFLAGIVVASHVVLLLGIAIGEAASLELTGSFWRWLLGTTFVLACALMLFGRVTAKGKLKFAPAQSMVGVLFSEHPSRAWFTGQRRLTRFVVIGLAAWGWWNFVVAPAIYGNCNARQYFGSAFDKFETAAGSTADPLSLAVPFVVTATSLEKSQERYFLFAGGSDEARRNSLGNEVWFKVVSDPRWVVVPEFRNEDLRSVAFASGSPFPVFSSHGVTLESLEFEEQFIDGGFAHNRPLDAARSLGASKALVLNSSPLPGRAQASRCRVLGVRISELACNLPRLVPYLWERSQTEDHLSSASMLVASLYPTAREEDWPALTDFRSEVVDRLIAAADNDWTRRIGVIESWGVPQFGDTRLVAINIGSVERMLREQR